MNFNTMGSDTVARTVLGYAQRANIGWLRVDFKGTYLLSNPDGNKHIVAWADSLGLQILGVLAYLPSPGGHYAHPDSAQWDAFVARTVADYPYVRHWSIWNEPNGGYYYGTEEQYHQLVRVAAPYIRTSNSYGMGRLIAGELIYAPKWQNEARPTRDFVARMLNSVGNLIDVVAIHMYSADMTSIPMSMESFAADVAESCSTPGASGACTNVELNTGWRPQWEVWLTEAGIYPCQSMPHAPYCDYSSPVRVDSMWQANHLANILAGMQGNSYWKKTFYWHLWNEDGDFPDQPTDSGRALLMNVANPLSLSDVNLIQPRAVYHRYAQIAGGCAKCTQLFRKWWAAGWDHLVTHDVNEGGTLDKAPFIWVSQDSSLAALKPLYRCYGSFPGGHIKHFISDDFNCWGKGMHEGRYGFIGRTQLPGTTPLYQFHDDQYDHYPTVDVSEIPALLNQGYRPSVGTNGILGYVWPG